MALLREEVQKCAANLVAGQHERQNKCMAIFSLELSQTRLGAATQPATYTY
jgi:hypothetical protein